METVRSTSKKQHEFAGKRVLMIVENLPSPFDRRVWHEATALRDEGAKVSIICPTGKGYEKIFEVIDKIIIFRYKVPFEADSALGYLIEYSWSLFMQFYLALKCLVTIGFDVIHICNPPDLIYLVASPFKLLGKKIVFDHHDINPELYEAKFGRKDFLYRMLLYFEKKTFQSAKVCIATNNSYKDIAIKRGDKKSEEVFVVRSGPDLNKFHNVNPDNRYKKGKKYLIGYVGVIGKQEGLDYLINAAKYIIEKKNRNDIHFICIGGGTELDNLIEYAKEENLSNHITFTGRIPDEELLTILSTADVCVNPDKYNEMNDKSTMNKILEYMALGKPIVQFDMTEGKFSAQQASLYAKPNDPIDLGEKILELLDNPQKRIEMGAFGFLRVKNELQWDYEKEHLYEAYRQVFTTSK